MNQTEIDELRRLASVSREPRHGIGCIASDCALASAARNAIPRLLAALEEARDERDRARQKIQAMEEQAMADEDGMSMRPLDGRLRKVEAERDALKEKLAALVEAADHASLCYSSRRGKIIPSMEMLGRAVDAAKVQP
jgi:uncharacterized coiled-coil DUF342 family protein